MSVSITCNCSGHYYQLHTCSELSIEFPSIFLRHVKSVSLVLPSRKPFWLFVLPLRPRPYSGCSVRSIDLDIRMRVSQVNTLLALIELIPSTTVPVFLHLQLSSLDLHLILHSHPLIFFLFPSSFFLLFSALTQSVASALEFSSSSDFQQWNVANIVSPLPIIPNKHIILCGCL